MARMIQRRVQGSTSSHTVASDGQYLNRPLWLKPNILKEGKKYSWERALKAKLVRGKNL